MFQGSMVALITPMLEDNTIDTQALHDLIEWHIASHTDALVIAGTTGESATLSPEEQYDLIARVVKQVAKRIPVIAGTGSNSTEKTIELTQNAKKAGADAALIVTPYYNKPTQAGLFEHYKKVAGSVDLPIILYNVPGRTGCDLLPETVEKLSHISNIIGIKEATGKLDRAKDIRTRTGNHFAIYSGDDETGMDLILQGGQGIISVTANVAPRDMHEMTHAALSQNQDKAHAINEKLMPLHKKLFLESNPIPTKWALHRMGKIASGIRLPLLPLDPKFHADLQEALSYAGIKA